MPAAQFIKYPRHADSFCLCFAFFLQHVYNGAVGFRVHTAISLELFLYGWLAAPGALDVAATFGKSDVGLGFDCHFSSG
jgi:hypothetical protein